MTEGYPIRATELFTWLKSILGSPTNHFSSDQAFIEYAGSHSMQGIFYEAPAGPRDSAHIDLIYGQTFKSGFYASPSIYYWHLP